MLLSRICSATPGTMPRPSLESARLRAFESLLSRLTRSHIAVNPHSVGGKYGDEFRPN